MYCIGPGTEVAVLNSEVVPISYVVLKAGFTVCGIGVIESRISDTVCVKIKHF